MHTARQQSKCRARKPQAAAHQAALRHHALTTSHTSTGARRSPMAAGCSHHFPASKARVKHPGSQQTLQGEPMGFRRAKRPKTHTHASQEHPHASQHPSCSQHGQGGGTEQKEAHLGFLGRRGPFLRSRRFRQSAPDFTRRSFLPPRKVNSPQIPPSPTHGASPTGYSWSPATSHRVWRLAARSDRSRPCACEHKRSARAPLASWEVL